MPARSTSTMGTSTASRLLIPRLPATPLSVWAWRDVYKRQVYPYIKDSFKLHKYYKGDELCFDTAEYLIGKYQPDVMYLHLVCIDYLRHNYGVFSKELWTGYEYLDKRCV